MGKPDRKRKTFELRLTRFELIHLRDLLSVSLAPDMASTVSQALAASEERTMVEARLWKTVVAACKEADVPLDAEAPDFVVAADVVQVRPNVGVFRLASDPAEVEAPAPAGGNNPFLAQEEAE